MTLVVLWSDALIYLLVAIALFMALRVMATPRLRLIWRKVVLRPINIAAIVVLFAYITIGILDSIHFRGKNQVGIDSVLDKIVSPIAKNTERSFSAPFAIYGFTKEAIPQPDGTIVRDYPRLKFGGAHLKSKDQYWPDIRNRLVRVILQTLIIGAALSLALLWWGFRKYPHPWGEYWGRVITGGTAFPWRTFLLTLILILFCIIFVGAFMPYYHILGTGQVGEDILYSSLKSIRTGLIIGTITTLVTLPFAILFGIMAGYFRGWIDDVIQYTYTTLSSIPAVLLIAAAVLTLQIIMGRHAELFPTVEERADVRLLALCAILGITSWTSLCRLLRGETLKLSQEDFVQAAHSLGSSHFSIIFKHLLPNVFHIVLITIALDFSGLVLSEAVLSYVGVGVDPTTNSFGMMINSARMELARVPVVWWSLSAAFVFMLILVLAANIFADAVRDAFDPRLRMVFNE